MKSTQIHRDKIGESEVSTIFVEPWNYYETAIRERDGSYTVMQWGGTLPIEAEAFHAAMVELVDKAEHYRER